MAFACRIVHAIAGRTRLRLPVLSTDPGMATHLVAYLHAQPGIIAVAVMPACDSLVVYAEPEQWTAATLGQWITALSPETLPVSHASPPVACSPPLPPVASWWPFSLASLAVAASTLSLPVVPFLAPLVIGAAWPFLTRAVRAWTQGPRLSTDFADVTATALLAWQGQWLPAASLLWLEHLSAMLHHSAQQRAAQALHEALATTPQRPWFHQHEVTTLAATQVQEDASQWAEAALPGRTALAATIVLGSGDTEQGAAVLVVGHGTGMQRVAPMAILSTMVQAARRGVLLPTGRHIEVLAHVDAVVFDTTVSFMQSIPEVTRVLSYRHQFSSDQILALAAAVQQHNPHPVAQAVVWEALARELELPDLTALVSTRGLNVEARIQEMTVCVGTDAILEQYALTLTQRMQRDVHRLAQRSNSVLYVAIDGRFCGLLAYTNPWRPDATETVQALQAQGVREIVVVAERPAQVPWTSSLPPTLVRFEPAWSPEEKMAVLHRLHAAGSTVAVVRGGGDAAVWSAADVCMALQDGTAVSQDFQGIITGATLSHVPLAIAMARDTMASVHRHWHSMTVANTLSVVLASVGGIGPLAAIGLSKGVSLLALGRTLYTL